MKTYKTKLNQKFIGRQFESQRLKQAIDSSESSIVVIYGRRRVGKTELIEQTTLNKKVLKFEGLESQGAKEQRTVFLEQLANYTQDLSIAKLQLKSWREIFILLYKHVSKGQWVLYFEELQWLANYRVDFVSDLKFVWDNYYRKNDKLTFILCGSSTSYMVKKVLRSRSLHNRSLHEIPVKQLSIHETKLLLGKGHSLRSVFDAFLTVGGIPEYLKYVRRKSSALIAILDEAFVPGGFFVSEFEKVFVSTLGKTAKHKTLVLALAQSGQLTRTELAKKLGIQDGGGLTEVLSDLVESGFTAKIKPITICGIRSHKRECYCLRDAYLHFYAKCIYPNLDRIERGEFISNKAAGLDVKSYQQFLGLSFERFCFDNQAQIAKKLGFESVKYKCSPVKVFRNGNRSGFQIDLLFERADKVATICELKYQTAKIGIEIVDEVEKKIASAALSPNYTIQKVLISASGISQELEELRYFDKVLGLDDFIIA